MNDVPARGGVRERLGLRPIVNVAGTMTSLGATIAVPEVAAAMAAILPEFVEIDDLHRLASLAIAKATGAEAGFVTASCSAAVTLSVAACMTGADLARIELLPDTAGMLRRVPIMLGHMVGYGAPVEQAIRLAGATVVPFGQVTDVRPYQLEAALGDDAACAVYVVSHHCVAYGQLTLGEFATICRKRNVPVIVDAASEYDLRSFLAAGADLVCHSVHKVLGGPTAGIIAGRKALVRAAFLQNLGIGRGMKVGKESILGTIAALEAWSRRDHAAVRQAEREALVLWRDRLGSLPGVTAAIVPDPTGNPLDRLRLAIDPEAARITAWELTDRLAAGAPPVIVRDHEVEHGHVLLDPCCLHPGESAVVAERIAEELATARERRGTNHEPPSARKERRLARILAWPD